MHLPSHLAILLHVIDKKDAQTVVQITDCLKPFFPPTNPKSQLFVRTGLKTLISNGWVQMAHSGKPRTFIRTRASYRVLPTSWTPPATHTSPQR